MLCHAGHDDFTALNIERVIADIIGLYQRCTGMYASEMVDHLGIGIARMVVHIFGEGEGGLALAGVQVGCEPVIHFGEISGAIGIFRVSFGEAKAIAVGVDA